MKAAASTIEFLLSIIIFVLFYKFAYWVTGATIDPVQLLIMYFILIFGSGVANGVSAEVYKIIMRSNRK